MAERETIWQEGEEGVVNYHAFLLRCWQEEEDGESQWRFTLVQMGEEASKKGFGCLEDVVAYLSKTLELEDKNNALK